MSYQELISRLTLDKSYLFSIIWNLSDLNEVLAVGIISINWRVLDSDVVLKFDH